MTFYVDTLAEAKRYGIEVKADSTSNPILEENENGLIKKDDNSIIIYVNPNDSLEMQRYTIAHALGHYINNHIDNENSVFRETINNFFATYDLQEQEANRYARKLLMPKEKIDFLLYSMHQTKVKELAYSLIVPVEAMKQRLNDLGYVSINYHQHLFL